MRHSRAVRTSRAKTTTHEAIPRLSGRKRTVDTVGIDLTDVVVVKCGRLCEGGILDTPIGTPAER